MRFIWILFIGISNACSAQIKQQLDSIATYPCVGYAIARQESNLGKSSLAGRTNNVYGLKSKDYRTGKTRSGYSKYNSQDESVMAYVEFEKRILQDKKINSYKKYLNRVAKTYAHKKHRKKWLHKVKLMVEDCKSKQ